MLKAASMIVIQTEIIREAGKRLVRFHRKDNSRLSDRFAHVLSSFVATCQFFFPMVLFSHRSTLLIHLQKPPVR